MSPERQRQVLGALVVVGLAIGGWQYFAAAPGGGPQGATTAGRAAPADAPIVPVDVTLDALEGGRLGPDDGGRNPFVFGTRHVAVEAPSTPRTERRAAADLPPPLLAPPGPPPLPPIPFKFIGVVEGTGETRRIAVLSDTKGLVVHGGEGTIIDGRFRILAIGAESLDIAYADGRGRTTLRLSGQ